MSPFAKHSVDIPQIFASYLEVHEMQRMKTTTLNLKNLKVTGKLNLFPNESSVQVLRDLETKNGFYEITWEDPDNLISNERRTNLERCLKLAGNVVDVLSVKDAAECFIDEISGWRLTSRGLKPYQFFKAVLRKVLDRNAVEAKRRKTCKKILMREAIIFNVPEDVSWLLSRKTNMSPEEIVENKISLEEPVYEDYKPLFFVLAHSFPRDCIEMIKILLQAGAEVNSDDNVGRTTLHYAVNHGVETVKLLLENHVDVNLRFMSNWQKTPLHSAHGSFELVKLLLEAGANVNAEDHNQWTPLMTCAIGNSDDASESVKTLIEKGAKLNATDSSHKTALMWAATMGNVEVVKTLLEAGATTENRNDDGTAAEIAEQNGHQNCADVINNYASSLN